MVLLCEFDVLTFWSQNESKRLAEARETREKEERKKAEIAVRFSEWTVLITHSKLKQ